MLSPRHRSYEALELFPAPSVESALHAQRLWGALLVEATGGQWHIHLETAESAFMHRAKTLDVDSLTELLPDIHSGLTRFQGNLATLRGTAVARGAITVASACVERHAGSYATPLLERVRKGLEGSSEHELLALCDLNVALAWCDSAPGLARELWQRAIVQMPDHRWHAYPTLLEGAHKLLHYYRSRYQQHQDFSALAEAVALSVRAYHVISTSSMKSDEATTQATTTLLHQAALVKEAADESGLDASELPNSTALFEHALLISSMCSKSVSLYVQTAISLTARYLQEEDPREGTEKARSTLHAALLVAPQLPPETSKELISQLLDLITSLPNFDDPTDP